MSLRQDKIVLSVNIVGNKAQTELNELKKKAADLTFELSLMKKGTEAYIAKNAELVKVDAQMGALRKELNLSVLTLKELGSARRQLTAILNSKIPGTAEFKKYAAELEVVIARQKELKSGIQGFQRIAQSSFSSLAKNISTLAAGYLGFQAVVSGMRNVVTGAGKMSDQLADLRRVAGLTSDEANELANSLKNIDTRTSNSNLRDIAITAGKLGVAKEDIFGFTKAVDMLVVTLGDELGDADQVTTQLGKILNVFDGKITADNISKLGNAIVDIANKGVATGGFIVDFTQRLSGVAKTAGISLEAILGLGAGLEENGAKVEASSTAIQKLLLKIGSDVPNAAKIAGKNIKEFSDLLANKPQEALLAYASGLVKNTAAFEEFSASLKESGDDQARVAPIIALLGTKTDFFKQKIEETGAALKSTEAITEGFAIKNTNLGAEMEKLGKEFDVVGEAVISFVQSGVKGIISFIQAIKEIPAWMQRNQTAIIAVATVVLAYVVAKTKATQAIILNRLATLLETGADKLEAAQKAVNIIVTKAYAVAKGVLTGQIKIATAAQRIWNFVLKQNPLVWVVLAVGALITALSSLTSHVTKLSAAQRVHNDLQKKIGEATADEEAKARSLFKTLQQTNLGYDAKKKLLAELVAINPQYLNGLTLENIKTQEGIGILDNYIKKLREANKAKALNDLILEKEKRAQEIKTETISLNSAEDKKGNFLKDIGAQLGIGGGSSGYKINSNRQELKDIEEELKVLYKDSAENITKAVTQGTTDADKVLSKTVSARKDFLEQKIKDLEGAYLSLNATDRKGQQQNLAQQQKYKEELDALLGSKTSGPKSTNSTYDNLIKEAQEFHKKLEELKFAREQAAKSDDQKEIDAVKHKYSEVLKEFDALQKKLNSKDQGILGSRVDITEAEQKELDALIEKHRKANFEKDQQETKDILSKQYADQQQQVTLYYAGLKDKEAKRFADGEIDYKTYQANIAAIDVNSNAALLKNAEDFSAQKVTINGKEVTAVEQAEKDVTAFQKAELDKRVTNTIKAAQAMEAERKLLADLAARAEISRVNTKGIIAAGKNDFSGVAAAEKERAGIVLAQRNAALDQEAIDAKTKLQEQGEERKRIEKKIDDDIKAQKDEAKAEYDQTVVDADNTLFQKRFETAKAFANATLDLFSNINQLLNNMEDRKLQKEIDRNNKRKNDLKHSLDSRLLSQKQYDKQIAALDEDIDKRKKELSIKQAKRQKALSIFEAITNTASAVVSALGAKPWGPWNIALAALVGALGLVQVGVISSAPLPEAAKGKWFREGDKHSDPSGGIPVMIERDEAVIKADAMTDKNIYTVTGTPSQITSKLNSIHGGVNWASGATIRPKFRERPVQMNPNLPLIMAMGGVAYSTRKESFNDSVSNQAFGELVNNKFNQVNEKLNKVIEVFERKQDALHAVVSLKEFKREEKKYNDAKKASGMDQ